MLFDFPCPHCNSSLEADSSRSGDESTCPNCGSAVAIPFKRIGAGTVLGGFRLEGLLGRGGMGEVFLATQLSMERSVAVKVLPPSFTQRPRAVARFLHEVRTAAKMSHPNIVSAIEAGEEDGVYYLAMDYVDGESLEERLERDGTIPETEALQTARAVADALAYAWDAFQILHRDIKPANIMVDRWGHTRLMDLGLAKSLSEDNGMTMAGSVLGTPHYMSPEQAESMEGLDLRADIYSLGASLYHLVTGSKPFHSDSALQVLRLHVTAELPPPRERNPSLSEPCAQLIEAMMAKDRDDRHAGWRDAIDDIDRVIRGESSALQPHAARKAKRHRVTDTDELSRRAGAALAQRHAHKKAATHTPDQITPGRKRQRILNAACVAAVLLLGTLIAAVALSRRHKGDDPPPVAATPSGGLQDDPAPPAPTATPTGTDNAPEDDGGEPQPQPGNPEAGDAAAGDAAPPDGTAPQTTPPTDPLPATQAPDVVPLFNGTDLTGWEGDTQAFEVRDGLLVAKDGARGEILTTREFDNFVLRVEFNLGAAANNGLLIRCPSEGQLPYAAIEIQIMDDSHPRHGNLAPHQKHGAIWGVLGARQGPLKPPGKWNTQVVRAVDGHITVVLNDEVILDTDVWTLTGAADGKSLDQHPGLKRRGGRIGLMPDAGMVTFRSLEVTPIIDDAVAAVPVPGGPWTVPGLDMEMAWIAPGMTLMGSTPEERQWAVSPEGGMDAGRVAVEQQQTDVPVVQGWWLGRHEVTVAQWRRFAQATGYVTEAETQGRARCIDWQNGTTRTELPGRSWRNPNYTADGTDPYGLPKTVCPVSCVTWNDIQAFFTWLNDAPAATQLQRHGWRYRLPSEAEWEAAARPGNAGTRFWWSDDSAGMAGRENTADRHPLPNGNPSNWGPTAGSWDDGWAFASPVGHYSPNSRGLHDMLGNVAEWCQDPFADWPEGHPLAEHTTCRAVRGGAFNASAGFIRIAHRAGLPETFAASYLGFRLCLGRAPLTVEAPTVGDGAGTEDLADGPD